MMTVGVSSRLPRADDVFALTATLPLAAGQFQFTSRGYTSGIALHVRSHILWDQRPWKQCPVLCDD